MNSTVYTDEFGNSIDFGHTEADCFAPPLLEMLESSMEQEIRVDVDKGGLFYELKKRDEFFELIETKIDLYGRYGKFVSKVKVPDLSPLKAFLQMLLDESNEI